jgi:hypothetical protein
MDLLGGTLFALDGCKLPGNAAKQWSGSVNDLKRKQEKLEEKVKELLAEQEKEDREGGDGPPDSDRGSHRQKQVEKLQRQADRIQAWLKENGQRIGMRGKEIKSNITDNESTKMQTSHGTIQGYNSQALVDARNQVIIHAEAFGNGQDHGHVPPMLDGARENMESIDQSPDYFKGKIFTADSNYHSKVNMQKCIDEELDAYIPDRNFRTRDPRFADQERYGHRKRTRYGLDDFRYDQERDQYECPNGKRLSLKIKKHALTGNLYRIYGAQEQDCKGCMVRGKCLNRNGRGPRTLSVPLGPDGINLTKLMIEKIESDQGRRIYPQRIAIVEPVFANLRIHKRLDRFTLRGKIKVNIQWMLYCMVHNIEKIANYGFA